MKNAVPSPRQGKESPGGQSRQAGNRGKSARPTYLSGLAAMANQSPVVQGQLKLQNEINSSSRVRSLSEVSAAMQPAPAQNQPRTAEYPAQLRQTQKDNWYVETRAATRGPEQEAPITLSTSEHLPLQPMPVAAAAPISTQAPIQRVVLTNVRVVNGEYLSQPHDRVVYRMIVHPDSDDRLNMHIEKAKAYARVGATREERLGLLFQYVDSLPKNEEDRNALYTPATRRNERGEEVVETDAQGNTIREALLSECLDGGAACRELSAFLQLLLADEGIRTNYTVGTVGGVFDAQRHAWLQIGVHDPDVVDPTLGHVGMKPPGYSRGVTVDLAEPIAAAAGAVDIEKVQAAAYDKKERSMLEKLMNKPLTLHEKAKASLATYSAERESLLARINRMIDESPILRQLETEEVFNRDVIARRSVDTLTNEVIPMLRGMMSWT